MRINAKYPRVWLFLCWTTSWKYHYCGLTVEYVHWRPIRIELIDWPPGQSNIISSICCCCCWRRKPVSFLVLWKLWSPNYGVMLSSVSRCLEPLTKYSHSLLIYIYYLTTFWHLFDNFLMASHCIWPIKMQGLWEAELSIVRKPTWRLRTPPLPFLAFWLASLKGSQQKVVKQMSQTCQKLIKNIAGWPQLDTLDCKLNRFKFGGFNPLDPKSDQHQISPHNIKT